MMSRMECAGYGVGYGCFVGSCVTAGVLVGIASLVAWRSKHIRKAIRQLLKELQQPAPSRAEGSDADVIRRLEERVAALEAKVGL